MLQRSYILDDFERSYGRRAILKHMLARQMGRRITQSSAEVHRLVRFEHDVRPTRPARGAASLTTVAALFVMWCLIGLVAAYDTYLLVKLQESIVEFEKNPLGLLLLKLDGGSVALFVACKLIGTSVVLGVIPILYYCKRSWGLAVASALTVAQLALLIVLTHT